MSIFQKSVVNKYLKNLDEDKVNLAYDKFQKFYGDKLRLHNIMQLKEENYQEGFLREIFVQVLGYTINPDKDYNLTTEFKNQKDSRKADGAILKDGNAIGVIELKSTKTKDLESIKEQAFGYKVNQPNCKYVITSNFQNVRFYIDNATEYEEFNLFDLSKDRFKILYLLINKESIFNNLPDKLKQETKFHDQQITEKLYRDYQAFKDRIFEFLVSGNPQYDKLTLFKKSQKLLDRFLFILFAEDSGLIPPNAISKIIEQWKMFVENDEHVTLYSRFQKFFTHLDKGYVYKQWGEIPAYNGGLFRYDEILDNPELVLPDGLLQNNLKVLSAYDFGSEVDVNILGHIFEHSLSEIEELTAELQGETTDKTKSKRKKDGIFYTPKYITKYIVENTVGALCKEKKTELQIKGLLIDDTYYQKNGKLNQKGKDLFETLQTYKNWLLSLKILDPACGSGAFLNQTLDYLITEHQQLDNIINELTGESIRYFDTDKQILENNIYGVDINEESVEIAKLSLWLRTAQKGRALSDLSGNIKCGNSLIDDPEVAGEKAFNWEKEFPHVFNPQVKEKVYQKIPETKPDYVKLVKEKSKEAQEKAEQAAKLSKEALELSKQVYGLAEKIDNVNEPSASYGSAKGGFDVVLGNPPYGILIDKTTQNYYQQNFPLTQYKTNLYILFIERMLQIFDKGVVHFIIPKSLLFNSYYEEIRRELILKTEINEIYTITEKVFDDAEVGGSLLLKFTIKRKPNINNIVRLAVAEKSQNFITELGITENYIPQNLFLNIPNCEISITSSDNQSIINKLHKLKPLKEYYTLKNGLNPGNIKHILITGNKTKGTHKPIIWGKEISRYGITWGGDYIEYDEKISENISLEELKSKAGMNKQTRIDFALRNPDLFENKKIVVRKTGDALICSLDKNNFYFDTLVHGIYEKVQGYTLEALLAILNSHPVTAFYRLLHDIKGKVFAKISLDNLGSFPIPDLNVNSKQTQQPFIEKAELMLSLNIKLQTEKQFFINTLKEEKHLQKITQALENFNELDFEGLKKEIGKQKARFVLGQETNEWREYFNTIKQKVNELQAQINQTDKEIDRMVYELYELTPEEIEIVENSLK